MIAIVLVGGKLSLLNEFYPDLPTPLIPVAGEPFLYWITQWLKSQGINHIVYSAGHHAAKISAWAQQMSSLEPTLCLDVVTETRPLGTAGAAAFCARRYPAPYTLILNGDSILLKRLGHFIHYFVNTPNLDAVIFGTSITNAGRYGTLEVTQDHRLVAFKEKHPSRGPINAGVYLLRSELLHDVSLDKESSLEYDYFPHWLRQGKSIQVVDKSAPFIDIDTPESLKKAHDLIQQYHSVIVDQKSLLEAEAS